MFIAPKFLMYPAPLGAACKLNRPHHMALRWSAKLLEGKAINMVLLRSTSPRSYHAKTTFRAKLLEL